MPHLERVGYMFRVLLITKNRTLADFCRKNLPTAFNLRVIAKLNLRTESPHGLILFDSDYLAEASESVLPATAERFGIKDGAAVIGVLCNEENKTRARSLFPENLNQIQAILQYRFEAGKITALTPHEWRWFLETQQRHLKQLSERALAVNENEVLAERLARMNAMPGSQIRFPAFMHGKSQAVVSFRERLLSVISREPYLFMTGKGDIPAEEFLEYYCALLKPEGRASFQMVDLAKTPKHLHAQALWPQKKKASSAEILCVQNLHLLGWQNQATLTSQLKTLGEKRSRYVFIAPNEINLQVKRGSFRQELYSLLRKTAVEVPPLYDRPDDLSQIAAEYISKSGFNPLAEHKAEIARKIMTRFDLSSGYQGLFMTLDLMNDLKKSKGLPVFELMNAAGSTEALKAAQSFLREEIEPDPASLFENLAGGEKDALSLDFVERNYIAAVCQRYAWQVTDAARHLGISRKTLYDKMRRYKIDRPENQTRGKARKAS